MKIKVNYEEAKASDNSLSFQVSGVLSQMVLEASLVFFFFFPHSFIIPEPCLQDETVLGTGCWVCTGLSLRMFLGECLSEGLPTHGSVS